MNLWAVLLWGFAATVILTTTMAAAQYFRLTRMSIPYMLGTMFTADHGRAQLLGFAVHLVNGWMFAVIYAGGFEGWGAATWWLGASIGLVHALFVLFVGMPMLPALHPRMATTTAGPTPTRLLQPPGFLAMHYGRRTAVVVVAAHLLYGGILGAFYPR
ncbi:MAG: hypothetical protein WD942_08285 [Dehalococcoidia bacterium]